MKSEKEKTFHFSFAHLAFELSLKALRHSFAISKEAQRKASLSFGGLYNFLGSL